MHICRGERMPTKASPAFFTFFAAFCYHFLLTCVFGASEQSRSYQPGDITLGGLFLLHYSTEDGRCGELYPTGLGHVEAMIFAIDNINKDPKLLPNLTLGYDIRDYCESTAKAMRHAYDFVRQNDVALNSKNNTCTSADEIIRAHNESKTIAAVIGPTDSGSSVVVGSLLQVAGIPVISHSATSNELSSAQYRNFFRTAPPDGQQASAMADVIQNFNWSFVAIVAMDDSYGRNGVRKLESEADKRKTFCIAFAELIPRQEYGAKIVRTVSKIKSYANVRVVVLWLFGGYGRQFLIEAFKQKLDDRTWILSEGLATQNDLFAGLTVEQQDIIHGSIGTQPQLVEVKNFDTFLIQEASTHRVPWWEEYLRNHNKLNCSLTAGRKNLSACQKMVLSSIYDTYYPYVVDAVFAVAHALHQMENCSKYKGTTPGSNEECPDIRRSLDPRVIDKYLRKVDFEGLTGRISFDSFGDPGSASYDIVHFQHSQSWSGQSRVVKIFIGSWENERKTKLRLNVRNISWNTHESQEAVPKSFCHDDCPPGTLQSRTTPCCWECIKCPSGTLSTRVNSINCTECPRGQKPNDERSRCFEMPEVEVSWSSVTSILVLLFATVGISLVIICSAVLYKYRNTPFVKATNRELSFILLITISLSFSVAILTLAKPTKVTCTLGVCFRSIVLTTFISILILKTMKILSAFRINVIAERFKKFILAAKSQSLLVMALLFVHVLLLVLWITLDPPNQHRTIQPAEETILVRCSLHHSAIGQTFQIAITVYTSFLAIVCTFYTFKARKLPENFNEARYIAFSMYILLLSCAVYYPVDIGLTGSYATSLTCAGTLLCSYGLLACMFGPKIYVILRQPEQNTQQAMSSQLSEYSFSSSHKDQIAIEPVHSNTNGSK